MGKAVNKYWLVPCVMSVMLLQGCATSIKATSIQNPPPNEAFRNYSRIELRPTVFKQGYSADHSGLAKIQANIQKNLESSLKSWNAGSDNGRRLIIEPIIDELEFKHGAKRVLLGPLAGSSGVLVHLTMTDAKGNVVANPEFFQRADAMAAGFIFGVHDNLMLTRVAKLATSYVIANYSAAVGGPTGADEKSLQK